MPCLRPPLCDANASRILRTPIRSHQVDVSGYGFPLLVSSGRKNWVDRVLVRAVHRLPSVSVGRSRVRAGAPSHDRTCTGWMLFLRCDALSLRRAASHLWKSMLCEKRCLGSKRVSGGRLLLLPPLLRTAAVGCHLFRFRSGSTFSQEFPQMSQHGSWPHEATIGPVSDSQRRSCCATRSMFICASFSPTGSPTVLPGSECSVSKLRWLKCSHTILHPPGSREFEVSIWRCLHRS